MLKTTKVKHPALVLGLKVKNRIFILTCTNHIQKNILKPYQMVDVLEFLKRIEVIK